ncbi:MAG: LysR family transcriptional regulator [Gammaproteobacteria bacterium]|nr:LysR family transcriptional regulator [Gammaproteobacteria bacterium]
MANDKHDLNSVTAFVEVARTGGFRSAAVELGVPASTLSTQIARLEQGLGIKLLDRTTRTVQLTEAGNVYLSAAKPALEALAEAAQTAKGQSASPSGKLRVTMPTEFGQHYMPIVFTKFSNAFPDVTLQCDLLNRRVNLLEEGYDVALRAGRLADSTLICRAVGPNQQMVTCASPDYLDTHPALATPDDLDKHKCITMSKARGTDSWNFKTSKGKTNIKITPFASVNNFFVLRDIAICSGGIIRIPRFLISKEIESGQLLEVLKDFTPNGLAIHALYPPSGKLSLKTKGFITALEQSMQV